MSLELSADIPDRGFCPERRCMTQVGVQGKIKCVSSSEIKMLKLSITNRLVRVLNSLMSVPAGHYHPWQCSGFVLLQPRHV